MSNRKSFQDRVESEKKSILEVLETTKKLKKEESWRAAQNRGLEKYYFNRFKEKIADQKFFRLSHINALGLKYDVCIHLSAKGSGKTTEILRMMGKLIEKGEKFMYGRVYKNELDREIIEFNTREDSPVFAVEFKGNWYFFVKKEIEKWMDENVVVYEDETIVATPTWRSLTSAGLKHVGRGYSFLNANCLSGGKYENYTTIFFDEILSYNQANRINKKVLDAWDVSVHTIQRNKENLKIYLFGNLQDVPSHPILDHYGINIDDDFRYIQRGEDGSTCNILYINSGGLYGATIGNRSGASQHMSAERKVFLKNNKVIKPNERILSPTIFDEMIFDDAFAIGYGRDVYFVELRRSPQEDDSGAESLQAEDIFAISCKLLSPTTLFEGEVYTDNPAIYNIYMNTTRTFSIEPAFNTIYKLFKCRELYFDTQDSQLEYVNILRSNLGLLYENKPNPIGNV